MIVKKKQQQKKIEPMFKREDYEAFVCSIPYTPTDKYAQLNVNVLLSRGQAQTLRCVQEALENRKEKLNDDKPVHNAQTALRWILEEVERVNQG